MWIVKAKKIERERDGVYLQLVLERGTETKTLTVSPDTYDRAAVGHPWS